MAFQETKQTYEEFIEEIKKFNNHADIPLITKAYDVANKAHEGQKRSTGEPYFVHPLEVALILVRLRADTATICAALLHDTVEDTKISLTAIRKDFGTEIAYLVEGVTKPTGKYTSKEEYKAETIRKILLATTKDVRVMLLRLADRLHNMRTLDTFREDKRKRIAKETLEIYAPIAHKLGIWKLKGELEDWSLRNLDYKTYRRIHSQIDEKRAIREKITRDIVRRIKEGLKEKGIDAEVFGRAKYFYSIYKKMLKKDKKIDQIYDLLAIRIITRNIEESYKALEIVHSLYPPEGKRMKDYIAHPKANKYQSIHTTVKFKKKLLEVQIRTEDMHVMAEEGIAAHWRYKGTERDKKFDQKLSWLKQILDWKRRSKNAADFVETLKIDLFENEIIVFTPKGDPISMPEGATPIDFAYEVHTSVGDHCSKAKVNGAIAALDSQLNSGDIVEILTQTRAHPSRGWLNFSKTKKAKHKIRLSLGIESDHRPKDDRMKIAERGRDTAPLLPRIESDKTLKISKCCPIQFGDKIIGLIMKDGKLSVHHPDCVNIKGFELERKIRLKWKVPEQTPYFKLRAFLEDRPGVLVKLLNFFAKEGLDVKSVNTRIKKKTIVFTFKIATLPEKEQSRLVNLVNEMPEVNEARVD